VSICGTDVDEDFPLAKSKLGVVNQEFNFSQFEKVIDVITAQAGYYGVDFKTATEKAESYLKKLGIWDKRNSIVRELSGGQKRRVMIIKALIHEPELLILDEPTAGVDIELRRSLWDFLIDINKAGTTIILTTHYLEEAENLCRNIAIIDEGQIIENTKMSNLLQQLENQVFSIETNAKLPENFSIEGFDTQVLDENKFTVIVPKDITINDLFDKSELKTIKVANMKNQTNRLEELFLNLTAK
jgi:ABC-2 type transport system ATP-binding protein